MYLNGQNRNSAATDAVIHNHQWLRIANSFPVKHQDVIIHFVLTVGGLTTVKTIANSSRVSIKTLGSASSAGIYANVKSMYIIIINFNRCLTKDKNSETKSFDKGEKN